MPNPLEKWKEFNLSEAYEVVKTAIVVMDERTYRIEVLKSYWNPNDPFNTRAWVDEDLTVQPTYPEGAKRQEMTVWVDYDLPWTSRKDADAALAQALGFLAERAKKK